MWIYLFIKPIHKSIVWEATTKYERKQVLNLFPKSKTIVIPNGINLNNYKNVKKLKKEQYHKKFIKGKRRYRKIVVSIGRLHTVKNLRKLILSFNNLVKLDKKIILLIAGNDAGEKFNLVKLVNDLGIENNVKFVGFLDMTNKIRFLKGANLFVCISKSENFANVVLEASACKVPSIVSKEVPWKLLEKYNCGKQINSTTKNITKTMKEYLYHKREKDTFRDFTGLLKMYKHENLSSFTNNNYMKLINDEISQ